jgi:hypothetical protein
MEKLKANECENKNEDRLVEIEHYKAKMVIFFQKL